MQDVSNKQEAFMKNILYFIVLISSTNVFAAQLKANNFSINLEYNKHSKPEEFRLILKGSCSAYSFLGSTECSVENNLITAQKINENQFEFERFKFKPKTNGSLVSSYTMNASFYIQSKTSGTTLYAYHSRKNNQDISSSVNQYFNKPIYITTVPSFKFDSSGELKSSKVTNSKLNLNEIHIYLEYILSDEEDKVIENVQWNQYVAYDFVEKKSRIENDKIKTIVNEEMFASSVKPRSLKVVITYQLKYFGKNKTVEKNYLFDDLNNINLAEKIGNINLQITDEDIE